MAGRVPYNPSRFLLEHTSHVFSPPQQKQGPVRATPLATGARLVSGTNRKPSLSLGELSRKACSLLWGIVIFFAWACVNVICERNLSALMTHHGLLHDPNSTAIIHTLEDHNRMMAQLSSLMELVERNSFAPEANPKECQIASHETHNHISDATLILNLTAPREIAPPWWAFGPYFSKRYQTSDFGAETFTVLDGARVDAFWTFPGSNGQIGIALAEPVFVSHVMIMHADDGDISACSCSPRKVVVWGIVDGEDNMMRLKRSDGLATLPPGTNERPLGTSHFDLLPLATFEVDIHDPSLPATQVVEVLPDIVELGVDFGIIILEVKSNWGSAVTCINRFGLYGVAASERDNGLDI